MIYEPRLAFDLRIALAEGVFRAIILAISDFISEENKPWSYYTGAALGYAAAATGIPNASATMFVVGSAVDLTLFHSEDGSDVQLFLNGVLVSTVDTYTGSGNNWASVGMVLLGDVVNRIDIINVPSTNGAKTSSINWLALGAVTVTGTDARVLRTAAMAYDTLRFLVADAEGGRPATYPHRVAAGGDRADLQTAADAMAELLDNVSGGWIYDIKAEISLDLPSGIKTAAAAASLNERGGLVSFNTDGAEGDSIWIPAILTSIAPGEREFPLNGTAMDALLDYVIANARTRQDYAFLTARRGKRSIHKR